MEDWLDPLPDADEMRALDAWATADEGIASLELMERAGAGLARLAAEIAPDGRIAVICGKGNNGGDGFVAARLLGEQGRDVEVICTVDPDDLSGDARRNRDRLSGVAVVRTMSRGPAVIVDAVLGTGTAGPPTGPARQAIDAICASGAPVVAADVPSGVDASTGEVSGSAVTAVATAAFQAGKPGLWIAPGKAHSGDVRVIEIGIPPGGPVTPRAGLIRSIVLDLIPRRASSSNKFSSGHVIVAGGSPGMTGAPCLAAMAAMRAGAGYVTACVPRPRLAGRRGQALGGALAGHARRRRVAGARRRSIRFWSSLSGPGRSSSAPASARRRPSSPGGWPPAPSCRWCSTPTASTRTPATRRASGRAATRRC